MTLKHSDRRIVPRTDVRPTERTCVKTAFGRSHTTWGFMIACVAIIGLVPGPGARAGEITLNIASVAGASIEVKGSGTGATIQFNNNASGQGFVVTASNGTGDSVGLHGTLDGTYSYTSGEMTTNGGLQSAPLVTNGATLTITDASQHQLTAEIAGIDVSTIGTHGLINVHGEVNLTSISYSGTNADLIDFSKPGAGVAVMSFTFVPAQSLTSLAASGSDQRASDAGTLLSILEPSGLILLAVGGLVSLGHGARRR